MPADCARTCVLRAFPLELKTLASPGQPRTLRFPERLQPHRCTTADSSHKTDFEYTQTDRTCRGTAACRCCTYRKRTYRESNAAPIQTMRAIRRSIAIPG